MARLVLLVILPLTLPAQVEASEKVTRLAGATETASTGGVVERDADWQMEVGRYYVGKRDYAAALNRFKIVLTKFPTSWYVEEALARLTETYLTLGLLSEAQTAVAVLDRRFPNGPWTAEARQALKSAGLEPNEDEKSWISQTFK